MGFFNLFGRVSGMVRYFLLVGFLSKAQFDLLTYAFYFGRLARQFMDGGLDNLISRDGARDPRRVSEFMTHGFVLKSILGMVFCLGGFVYLYQFREKSASELVIIYVSLIGSVMAAIVGVLRSGFTANERMEYVLYTNLPSRIISILLLFASLYFSFPLVVVAGAVSLENVIWFVLLGWVGLRYFPMTATLSRQTLRYMIVESWPLAVYGFFNVFYLSLDVMMIEYLMRGQEHPVAPYTYASLLIEGVTMLVSGYLIAIYPALSRYYKIDEDAYRRLFRQSVIALVAVTAPTSVLLGFWSHGWMNLIKDTGELPGQVLQVLSIVLVISVINTLIIVVFTSRDHQRWLVGLTGGAVVVSFLSNWLLIPIYGQLGAAYASLFSQLMLLLVMIIFSYFLFALSFPIVKPLGIALVALLAGWITHAIPAIPLLAVPFVYALAAFLLARGAGVLTRRELQTILRSFHGEKSPTPEGP